MTTRILFAIALLAAPNGVVAAKPESLTLKPSSAWQVDYAEDRCRLGRQFGIGDQQTLLFMDRYGPEEYFRLTVSGKLMKTSSVAPTAEIQFGPSEAAQQLEFLPGNLAGQPAFVFVSRVRVAPPSALEFEAIKRDPQQAWDAIQPINDDRKKAIKFFRVGKPLRADVILETGSMRAPLAALDSCIDNLLTTWGIDVARHKTMTRPVKSLSPPEKWVVSSDYPMKMLMQGQPAIVEFRLSVNAEGAPVSCHIQSTTRPKEFDEAVCGSLMKRARFAPALDAEAKPIASFYRNTVRFAIPRY